MLVFQEVFSVNVGVRQAEVGIEASVSPGRQLQPVEEKSRRLASGRALLGIEARQELPRELLREGLISSMEAPLPSDATGQGKPTL